MYRGRMTRRDSVLLVHRQAIKDAAARRKAKSIALIGSVARGDDADDSDCDFLVDFESEASIFDVCGLESDLEKLLGSVVDVVDSAGSGERRRVILEDMLQDAVQL